MNEKDRMRIASRLHELAAQLEEGCIIGRELKTIADVVSADDFVETIRRACRELHVTEDVLRSEDRRQKSVFARYTIMYICTLLTTRSTSAIGDYFRKHHATVILARDQTCARMRQQPAFAARINTIVERVRQGTHKIKVAEIA
jgi:chromosomal replication initiation ATPase DnaA